ncbi:MAG: NTP transferase domain-containing protein [Bacillota bacterium]
MKALIMAAGKGTRISRYINDRPKCTVDIGGITLIENTIVQLRRVGIKEIGIVLGYKKEVIIDLLKDYDVKFYINHFFDVTNSIASLWFAKDFLESDNIIFLNGDVFCEEALYKLIINEKKSPVFFADETRKEEADYKFFYKNNRLIKYGKELSGDDITGEYIGIGKIDKEFIPLVLDRLQKMIESQQHGKWWEDVLYSLTDITDILVKDVEGLFWAEVDYVEDYERILEFQKNKQLLKLCPPKAGANRVRSVRN